VPVALADRLERYWIACDVPEGFATMATVDRRTGSTIGFLATAPSGQIATLPPGHILTWKDAAPGQTTPCEVHAPYEVRVDIALVWADDGSPARSVTLESGTTGPDPDSLGDGLFSMDAKAGSEPMVEFVYRPDADGTDRRFRSAIVEEWGTFAWFTVHAPPDDPVLTKTYRVLRRPPDAHLTPEEEAQQKASVDYVHARILPDYEALTDAMQDVLLTQPTTEADRAWLQSELEGLAKHALE
jgi:hypothetical protein